MQTLADRTNLRPPSEQAQKIAHRVSLDRRSDAINPPYCVLRPGTSFGKGWSIVLFFLYVCQCVFFSSGLFWFWVHKKVTNTTSLKNFVSPDISSSLFSQLPNWWDEKKVNKTEMKGDKKWCKKMTLWGKSRKFLYRILVLIKQA